LLPLLFSLELVLLLASVSVVYSIFSGGSKFAVRLMASYCFDISPCAVAHPPALFLACQPVGCWLFSSFFRFFGSCSFWPFKLIALPWVPGGEKCNNYLNDCLRAHMCGPDSSALSAFDGMFNQLTAHYTLIIAAVVGFFFRLCH